MKNKMKNRVQYLNKILLSLLVFIIVGLPFISALDFDNRGDYDEQTRTITINNLYGYGATIAEIKLISELRVYVMPGKDRKIAEMEFPVFDSDYTGAFKKMDFFDLNRGGEKFDRAFTYKRRVQVGTNDVPVYSKTCQQQSTGNGTETVCTSKLSHYDPVPIYSWNIISSVSQLSQGDRVGIFTDVLEKDYVEWVPTFFGVEIDDWAVWTSGFDVGLITYYNMDETVGDGNDTFVGGNNLTIRNNLVRGSSGINGTGYKFNITDAVYTETSSLNQMTAATMNAGTISLWINVTEGFALNNIMYMFEVLNLGSNNDRIHLTFDERNSIDAIVIFADLAANTDWSMRTPIDFTDGVERNKWHQIVITHNGTFPRLYFNGTEIPMTFTTGTDNTTWIGDIVTASANRMSFGADRSGSGTGFNFNGNMDEFAMWNRALTDSEVSDLYNGGVGIFPLVSTLPVLTIVLNTPASGSSPRETTIEFNTTFTIVNGNLTNATFYVWDSSGSLFNNTVTSNITGQGTNSTVGSISSFLLGDHTWNAFVCSDDNDGDAFCAFSAANSSFTVAGFTENSQTFNNDTLEGNLETFIINLTHNSSFYSSISSNLVYNSTTFSSVKTGTGDEAIFTAQAVAPGVKANTTISFNWEVTLVGPATTVFFNSTSNIQSVLDYNVTNCTVNSIDLLNFSVVDEEKQTSIIADYEISTNIFNFNRGELLSTFSESGNSSSIRVCANVPQLNNTFSLLDTVIRYSGVNYATEYFNLANVTINNETGIQNIILFDLNATDSTEFRLTFTGNNFLPQPGVLVFLDRQYIAENIFKTVELPITDPNGQTILHMVRNDIIYNIRFVDLSGQVVGNFQEVTAFCEDPLLQNCQISLSATSNVSATFNYDSLTGLAFPSPPVFNNNTGVVSFDFVVSGGAVRTVSMNVTRNDAFGSRTICDDTVISSSGTLSCSVDPAISDTTLYTQISVGSRTVLISTINIDSTTLGSIGYVMWFILTLVMILGFGESKNTVLASLVVSYVGAVLLGFSKGSILGFGAGGTWIIIVTVLAIWRLNKDKVQ